MSTARYSPEDGQALFQAQMAKCLKACHIDNDEPDEGLESELQRKIAKRAKSYITPDSVIKSACRLIFMRSRERAFTMKRDNYTCVECGAKQSKAKGKEVKVECHHRNEIPWPLIIRIIRRYLLPDPREMECLCRDCHKQETDRQRMNQ